MKKLNLFYIGGVIFSICLALFTIALLLDDPNVPADPEKDWIGITWTVAFFASALMVIVGAVVDQKDILN